ncbi:MAG: hypothetical protein Q9183_007679, partial [Haloplaca sp. 2 TL-2023]
MADSSDDEIPVPPMKLSAEAKAILGDEASVMERSSPPRKSSARESERKERDEGIDRKQSSPPSRPSGRAVKEKSVSPRSARSGSPRIVRINPARMGSTTSAPSSHDRRSPHSQSNHDMITPAPRPRSRVAANGYASSGQSEAAGSELKTVRQRSTTPGQSVPGSHERDLHEAASHMGNMSIGRKTEESGVHTSIRVKRLGGVGGRYLSGPARRGMKRRPSEEEQSPVQGDLIPTDDPPKKQEEEERWRQGRPASPLIEIRDDKKAKASEERRAQVRFQSQPNVIAESPARDDHRLQRPLEPISQSRAPSNPSSNASRPSQRQEQPSFK